MLLKILNLLECNAVVLSEWFLMFRRITVPSSSGRCSPNLPEDGCTVILQNVKNYSPNYTAALHKKLEFSTRQPADYCLPQYDAR
jgi:hypothetical protein